MSENKKDFFISYNKDDKQWAMWIAETLKAAEKSILLQEWDFRPDNNFSLDTQKALLSTEHIIAILSPNFLSSSHDQEEWAATFTKNSTSEKQKLIPIRIVNFKPKGLFASIAYIDLFNLDEETAKKTLLKGINFNATTHNRPINNIPYARNNCFVGRDRILETIHNTFLYDAGTVVLTQTVTDLGGIGKTQTALEYAYRYAAKYDYIGWIAAESETTVVASYKDFAVRMKLLNKDQYNKELIIETVLNWLYSNSGWLFVYDNIEELSEKTSWWPKKNKGNILITTRNHLNKIGTSIKLDVFTIDEAVRFLMKRTGISDYDEDHLIFSRRLGYLPLALEQAAAFMVKTASSYAEYLELLDKHGFKSLEQVNEVIIYEKLIMVTLETSINQIKYPAARQILYLCAYLASDNIDPKLFREKAESLPSPLKEIFSDSLESCNIWAELVNYSLLQPQGERGYSMHRLLQEMLRKKLKDDSQWAQYVFELLCVTYDFKYDNLDLDFDSHNRFLKLSLHVESFLDTCNSFLMDDKAQKNIAGLYMTAGHGNSYLGNYMKAVVCYEKALAINETILDTKHPDSINIYSNIADTYSKQGDYAKAVLWYDKVLTIREQVLGEEHPGTVNTCYSIAKVYYKQKDYANALQWYDKTLIIREKVLGTEHPDTADTCYNIAVVYHDQEDYTNALQWYDKTLTIREKVLGTEHPDTADTCYNIAVVYHDQEDYTNALQWYDKTLVIREKILGTEHPDNAKIYHKIAVVYHHQENYVNALEWYEKALTIREKILGTEHPDTVNTYCNIADIYAGQKDYAKALVWYDKALGKERADTTPGRSVFIFVASLCFLLLFFLFLLVA